MLDFSVEVVGNNRVNHEFEITLEIQKPALKLLLHTQVKYSTVLIDYYGKQANQHTKCIKTNNSFFLI